MTFLAKWTQEWWFNHIPLPLTHNFLKMVGVQQSAKHLPSMQKPKFDPHQCNKWVATPEATAGRSVRVMEKLLETGAAGQELRVTGSATTVNYRVTREHISLYLNLR